MATRGGLRMKMVRWRRKRRQAVELPPPRETRKIVMAGEVFYVRPMRMMAENECPQGSVAWQPNGDKEHS